MLLVKQLKYQNFKEVKTLGTILHQIRDLNCNGMKSLYTTSCLSTNTICHTDYCGMNAKRPITPNFIAVRHHYRNYDYHPSRIVRAYRITRTWLTDHFVIAEKRLENIYSFLILLTTAVLLVIVARLNLQLGGEAGGFDINRLKTDNEVKDDSNKK